jgi:hypothetical protein
LDQVSEFAQNQRPDTPVDWSQMTEKYVVTAPRSHQPTVEIDSEIEGSELGYDSSQAKASSVYEEEVADYDGLEEKQNKQVMLQYFADMNLEGVTQDPEILIPVMMETVQQMLDVLKLPIRGDVEETEDESKFRVTLYCSSDDPQSKLWRYKMDMITEFPDSFLFKVQQQEHDLQLRINDLHMRYQSQCESLKDLRTQTVQVEGLLDSGD